MRYAVLVVALVAGLVSPAGAHGRTVLDADDSVGPLDVVAARMKHPAGEVTLRLVTYEEWGDSVLEGDRNFVSFELDRPGKPGIERCVVLQTYPPQGDEAHESGSAVYRHCNAPLPYSRKAGTMTRVHRADGHGIEVRLDADVLWKNPPESFRWRALTSYEDSDHPGCEPPDPMPPEHWVGTCGDWTAWNTHRR